ncbi:unnamed protein product, partial [Hapterophycus canaliculatus]
VFIVGNGVACSPTLLDGESSRGGHHGEDRASQGGEHGRAGASSLGRNRDGSGSGRDGARGEGPAWSPEKYANLERAVASRQAALRELVGIGGASEEDRGSSGAGAGIPQGQGGLSAHELFRQAADLGDSESYFYLSLLQAAGLHGGQVGGGKEQARTWALCGTHAGNMKADLLLA